MNDPLFFVLRHGKTAGNAKNDYRGWSNGPEAQLDTEGKEGVRDSVIYLSKMGYRFAAILTDDLDRTKETAAIAADILGVKHTEVIPSLKPLDVGEFTGKSKSQYPLEEYMKDKSKKIPGGESLDEFEKRMGKTFADVMEIIEVSKLPLLIIGHGSTVSFLNNNMSQTDKKVGYEGLVEPSGLLMFTDKGIIPLTKLRNSFKNPYADGTALAGFVTDEENRPPRECWNCRNFIRDVQTYTGSCTHIIVRIDPELQKQKQTDGTIAVADRDCCNFFRNKIST